MPATASPRPASQDSELRKALGLVSGLLRQATAFGLGCALLALVSAGYMSQVYARVVPTGSLDTLLWLTAAVLVAYLLLQAQEWGRAAVLDEAGRTFDELLERRVFDAAIASGLARQVPFTVGATRDLTLLRDFIGSQTMQSIYEVPVAFFLIGVLFLIHPTLGAAGILAVTVQLLVVWLASRRSAANLREANRLIGSVQQRSERMLSGAAVIKAMAMTDALRAQLRAPLADALELQRQSSQASSRASSITRFVQMAASSAVVGLSALQVIQGDMVGVGVIIVVSGMISSRAMAPLVQLVSSWQSALTAWEAWKRLDELLHNSPPVVEPMPLPKPEARLSVEGVAWARPDGQLVLRDLNFELEPGDALVVIGPSGVGKTTLSRLLAGLLVPAAGVVRLSGANVATWPKDELGAYLGYLPQEVELIDGTLHDNIGRFGPPDAAQLGAALESAGLRAWVDSLSEGVETRVGPAGAFLSGGYRQRVGLARAVYGQPVLAILDEPDAHLDEAGEAALARLIGELRAAGGTVVVITHRMGIFKAVNKMLLLAEGRQVAFGEISEVLARLRAAEAAVPLAAPPGAGAESR